MLRGIWNAILRKNLRRNTEDKALTRQIEDQKIEAAFKRTSITPDNFKSFYRRSLCRAMVEQRDAAIAFTEAQKRSKDADESLSAWVSICKLCGVRLDTPHKDELF